MAIQVNVLSAKFADVKNRYIAIFAVEGAGVGVLFYLLLRHTIRNTIDVSQLIPQFPYVGIVANIIGLGLVLPLVVYVTIMAVKRLSLHKV